MRAKAVELLARLVEAGIMVLIVDTLRTEAEHQAKRGGDNTFERNLLLQDGLG
jgi:hypothetical protein